MWRAHDAPDASHVRVMTLNIGGRNTNSFEFEMRGDHSASGKRWVTLYQRAKSAMRTTSPRAAPGLASAIDNVLSVMNAREPREPKGVLSRALDSENWTRCMAVFAFESKHLVNACNLASLRDGRPAPLEMPENVLRLCQSDESDASSPENVLLGSPACRSQQLEKRLPPNFRPAFTEFLQTWLAWLRTISPRQMDQWRKKAEKRKVDLGQAVAALLIFDAMCFVALLHMYAEGCETVADADPETVAGVVRQHTLFHDGLPFTTETGKYMKLVEVLAELRWPEAVMLQEAYDLAARSAGRHGASALDAKLFGVLLDRYEVCVADETVLLLRRDAFADVEDDDATLLGPDGPDWRVEMTRRGRETFGDSSQLFVEWQRTLERTVVARARCVGSRREAPGALIPAQWSAGPRKTPETGPEAVFVALHGKNGSEVTTAFVPELAELLTSGVPGVAAYVVGMDSNSSNAESLASSLEERGMMSSPRQTGSSATVAKARTIFQTQIRKTDLLDVSRKDFVLAWRCDEASPVRQALAAVSCHAFSSFAALRASSTPQTPTRGRLRDEAAASALDSDGGLAGKLRALKHANTRMPAREVQFPRPDQHITPVVERLEQFPVLHGGAGNVSYLMPSNQWPFDHCVLLAAVRLR